jgi:hypothetical protein
MSNNSNRNGNGANWFIDNSSASLQENLESKRTTNQDSLSTSKNKREADKRTNRNRRHSAAELVAELPDCGVYHKSIDELIDETHAIITLWGE